MTTLLEENVLYLIKVSSRVATGQEVKFYLGSAKIEINTADLVSLDAGRDNWVIVISTMLLPNKEGKFVENMSASMSEWKGGL